MPQTLPETQPSSGETALIAEGGDFLAKLERARDLIAGRVEPESLPSPPEVEESLQRLFPDRTPPNWVRQEFLLQHHYGGRAVVGFRSPTTGVWAVLAVGLEEGGKLVRSLTNDEVDRIVVRFPMLWQEDEVPRGDDAVA